MSSIALAFSSLHTTVGEKSVCPAGMGVATTEATGAACRNTMCRNTRVESALSTRLSKFDWCKGRRGARVGKTHVRMSTH